MGDSRICSRGFLEVVIHGALARRKIFHYYLFHLLIIIAKDSPKEKLSRVTPHASRGVWGHASPGNFLSFLCSDP